MSDDSKLRAYLFTVEINGIETAEDVRDDIYDRSNEKPNPRMNYGRRDNNDNKKQGCNINQ